jgi:hypothetical protein
VATAGAVHAQWETADYIAGKEEDGNRGSGCFLFSKGNQPELHRAVFGAIQADGPREPDHTELDYGHGRVIRRDRYDLDGTLISREIACAVTSLEPRRAGAAGLAGTARTRGAPGPCTGCGTAYAEDPSTGQAGNGPQVMAASRISLPCLAGVTEITRILQAIGRDRTRIPDCLPL